LRSGPTTTWCGTGRGNGNRRGTEHDVHGCSAALAALVWAIALTPLDTLVFLGDYIDRGTDSRGVLEQVSALAERCVVVPLLGDHEEMVLASLEWQSDLR
jgi:serine/threonine protein phosphatase 1